MLVTSKMWLSHTNSFCADTYNPSRFANNKASSDHGLTTDYNGTIAPFPISSSQPKNEITDKCDLCSSGQSSWLWNTSPRFKTNASLSKYNTFFFSLLLLPLVDFWSWKGLEMEVMMYFVAEGLTKQKGWGVHQKVQGSSWLPEKGVLFFVFAMTLPSFHGRGRTFCVRSSLMIP